MKCFPSLSDDSVIELLKVATLITVRKSILLYTRNASVESLFIVRSGAFEINNIEEKPIGYTEQVLSHLSL